MLKYDQIKKLQLYDLKKTEKIGGIQDGNGLVSF